jgi:hypothetical protein
MLRKNQGIKVINLKRYFMKNFVIKTLVTITLSSILMYGCFLTYGLFTLGQDWGDDFSAYLMQAQSIVNSSTPQFLLENQFTVEESSFRMGPVAYPWGYPLLLAPIVSLFGLNVLALKLVTLSCYALFLGTIFWGYRPLPYIWRLMAVAFFAFNPFIAYSADRLLSDIPFLTVSTLAIFWMQQIWNEKEASFSITKQLFLGLLLAAGFAIRTNGILLVATLIIAQLIKSYISIKGQCRYKSIAVLGLAVKSNLYAFAVFVLASGILMLLLPSGGVSHFRHLAEVSIEIIYSNLIFNLGAPVDLFSSHKEYVMSTPFFIVGLFVYFREQLVLALYFLMTLALYVLWPSGQDVRFMLPLFPIYIYFCIKGLIFSTEYLWAHKWGAVLQFALLLLILPGIISNFRAIELSAVANRESGRPAPEGPYSRDSQELFEFIKLQTPQDAILIFRKPRVMRLFTQRSALMITDINKLDSNTSRMGRATIVILDKKNTDLQPDILNVYKASLNQNFKILFENRQFQVYRMN